MEKIITISTYLGLLFAFIFIFWRVLNFRFKRNKFDKLSFLLISLAFLISGHFLKEYLESLYSKHSSFEIKIFSFQFVVYLSAILILLIGLFRIVKFVSELIFEYFIDAKWEKLKKTDFWPKYKEYRSYLDNDLRRKRLNYKGLLKYDKKEIFPFWMAESYEEGFLVVRIKRVIFIVGACIIFFAYITYKYSDFTYSFEEFCLANNGANNIQYYWLFVVWSIAWLISILAIIFVARLGYKVYDNYYHSSINYDDHNYYFVRAKKSEEKQDFSEALKYWKHLRKQIGRNNWTLGLTVGSEYPPSIYTRERIDRIIKNLEDQIH